MTGKDFFGSFLSQKLEQSPGFLADAGVRSQSVTVDIEGGTGGQWTLSFDGAGHASLALGSSSRDCTIHMNEKTWKGVLDGSLNIPMAVVMRKIKIKGDTGLAAKVGMALRKHNPA